MCILHIDFAYNSQFCSTLGTVNSFRKALIPLHFASWAQRQSFISCVNVEIYFKLFYSCDKNIAPFLLFSIFDNCKGGCRLGVATFHHAQWYILNKIRLCWGGVESNVLFKKGSKKNKYLNFFCNIINLYISNLYF